MKTVIACLITAAVVAGGAQAYGNATRSSSSNTVTAAQFAALKDRVAVLEKFQRECLIGHRINLAQNSDGVIVWNSPRTVTSSEHSGTFYGYPDFSALGTFCYTGR